MDTSFRPYVLYGCASNNRGRTARARMILSEDNRIIAYLGHARGKQQHDNIDITEQHT